MFVRTKVMFSIFLVTISVFQFGGFSVVFADDPTDQVRQLLDDNSTGGTVGLYLKEVDGSVLASLNEAYVFEPASTIKALIHFHAIRQVQDGTIINGQVVTLSTQVPWFMDITGSCPDLTGPASDTLQVGLQAMMFPSDNRWTQALRDFFGDANIDATRQAITMSDTKLQHLIGCGADAVANHNQLTLVDAGELYEAVATGFLNPGNRTTAYANMANANGILDPVITQEVLGLGLSSGGLNNFKSQRNSAAKAGGYSLSDGEYTSIAGWAQLPFKDSTCTVSMREYVFGAFIDAASTISATFSIWTSSGELLREQIRAALETWAECEADLKILSFSASASPAEVLIGGSFMVDLTKTFTSDGPASTVDVDISVGTNGTAGLTIVPLSHGQTVTGLGMGDVEEVIESFTITCDGPGAKKVTFVNQIAPVQKSDPNLLNNEATVMVIVECVIPVKVNIRPGGFPNSVNLKSKNGAITVAILTTSAGEYGLPVSIDATMIDPVSVHFGPMDALFGVDPAGGATESHNTGHVEDSFELDEVTLDGDLDMVLHFNIQATGLDQADTEACVKGQISIGGVWYTFFGCDSVNPVP